MYLNTQNSLAIDFVDLLLVYLKKIFVILICGIVISGMLFGYKTYSNVKASKASENTDLLDVSVKLPNESEVDYANRIQNVNRAKDIISSIDVLNKQIENQRYYVSNSVIMQIEPEHEAVTTANLIVTVDASTTTNVDLVILSLYKQFISSGEYLQEVSEELDIDQGYLIELISVSYDLSDVAVNSPDSFETDGIITIRVIGPTTDLTETVMDSILKNVEIKSVEFNEKKLAHKVSYAAKQSSYMVDNGTRDKQVNATNRFEVLQQQIKNYDKAIDEIATNLGISKTKIYEYFSFSDLSSSEAANPIKSSIKYAVLGFAVGVFVALLFITFRYIFSNKFATQAGFFSRFNSVNRIGVVKPIIKRSNHVMRIDKLSGDDNCFSTEKSNMLLASNVKNLIVGKQNVLFTGTADPERIDSLVKQLGIDADVKTKLFDNPSVFETFSKYDAIVIVEQRNYSDCRLISEELNLIANSKSLIIGAIIL